MDILKLKNEDLNIKYLLCFKDIKLILIQYIYTFYGISLYDLNTRVYKNVIG